MVTNHKTEKGNEIQLIFVTDNQVTWQYNEGQGRQEIGGKRDNKISAIQACLTASIMRDSKMSWLFQKDKAYKQVCQLMLKGGIKVSVFQI